MRIFALEFIESKHYSRRRESRMNDAGQRTMEVLLRDNPRKGSYEPGTGGIRKLRVGTRGRGKSSSVRVINYYHSRENIIYLLEIYEKHEQNRLTDEQRKVLKQLGPVNTI